MAVALLALGIPEPLAAALAIVPALELAGLLPLTPANLGAASAAVSAVLHAREVPLPEAVPASIVLHGIETAAGVLFGAGSAFFLLAPKIAQGAGSLGNRGAQAYRLVRSSFAVVPLTFTPLLRCLARAGRREGGEATAEPAAP